MLRVVIYGAFSVLILGGGGGGGGGAEILRGL